MESKESRESQTDQESNESREAGKVDYRPTTFSFSNHRWSCNRCLRGSIISHEKKQKETNWNVVYLSCPKIGTYCDQVFYKIHRQIYEDETTIKII